MEIRDQCIFAISLKKVIGLSGEMRSRTQMQRNLGSLITKLNKRTKTTPKGKNKQAGRQKTGAQSNM